MISIAIYKIGSPVIERIVGIPSITCPLPRDDRESLGLPANYADSQCMSDESWIEVPGTVEPETHYVSLDDGSVLDREAFDFGVNSDGLVVRIDGLPDGSIISAMGQEMTADGDDEIEFDVPGTYRISLSHPHYLDETLEVTVG